MKNRVLLILALGSGLAMIGATTAGSVSVGGLQLPDTTLPDTTLPDTTLPDTDPIEPPAVDDPLGGGGSGGGGSGGGGSSGGGSGGGGSSGGGSTTTGSGGGTTTNTEEAAGPGKKDRRKRKRKRAGGGKTFKPPPIRNPDGSPTNANPGLTIAEFGAAPLGVPNFVIDSFEIPPFLLPIYQAYGAEYGIPWQVLASINRIETDFGRNLNVSSAGAMGWMQFIPSSWQAYGCDGNEDGRKDPYNPVDAICAAARYLRAAGGQEDLRRAIFAYNHADWYVDEVLLYANQYGKLPDDLVGSLTGLTEGAHFPVAADARYADDISEREALKRSKTNRTAPGNAADVVSDSPTRRGIDIYSRVNAPVVAVNDGVITALGRNRRLGRHIVLTDAYGNRYTYAGLGAIAADHPVPKEKALGAADFKMEGEDDARGPGPKKPATAGGRRSGPRAAAPRIRRPPPNTEERRERPPALPDQPSGWGDTSITGRLGSPLAERVPTEEIVEGRPAGVLKFNPKTMQMRALRLGSKVAGGTVLGRIGDSAQSGAPGGPHLNFTIRPAGKGAPKIDPKPILDGWKLLETTAIYRAAGEDPFGSQASIGQILLMSKETLAQRTLADPRVQVYSCGRSDIEAGQIDRRVLAVLGYLARRGYRLTVTSLKCGHSYYTSSGSVSAHSSGNAVDIAQVNGLPILGNQGRGSVTEAVLRDLLQLQGTMRPAQIISLMDLGGPTFALSDHDDHIHVGYTPPGGAGQAAEQLVRVLRPEQWQRLIERLGQIDNPEVRTKPSKSSLPAGDAPGGRDSSPHRGD